MNAYYVYRPHPYFKEFYPSYSSPLLSPSFSKSLGDGIYVSPFLVRFGGTVIPPIVKKSLLSGSLYATLKLSRTFSKINGRSLTVASLSAKSEAIFLATIC